MELSLKVIKNRIDQFGIREYSARQVTLGDEIIIVTLLGVKEPQRIVDLISRTGLLELKLLDEEGDVDKALNGDIPPDDEMLYQYREGKSIPYLVKKETLLTGDAIRDARVEINQWDQPYITIELDNDGANKFAEITEKHIGERLAIILDNVIQCTSVIKNCILSGNMQITGDFTMDSILSRKLLYHRKLEKSLSVETWLYSSIL